MYWIYVIYNSVLKVSGRIFENDSFFHSYENVTYIGLKYCYQIRIGIVLCNSFGPSLKKKTNLATV